MTMNEGQALHNSPYVEQIEKFAASLKQLSQTFLGLENRKQAFSTDEIDGMFDRVKEQVCEKCENVPGAGEKTLYILIRWGMKCSRR